MSQRALALFSLRSGHAFGERVAAGLGVPLAAHEEREFEWGHHKSRPLERVRGRDVYVVASLHGDAAQNVNDKLCRLLFFLGALRDADPGRLTVVAPFLCYSRKDRQTKLRDPVITRYVATLFEAVGVDRVATVEVHNLAAFQNAFRCRTEHIETGPLVADVLARELSGRDLVVVSPDPGGIKRAEIYRDALSRLLGRQIPAAFVEKHRSQDIVTGEAVVGDVAHRTVVLVDDLISGGTTLARAAQACRREGAAGVVAAAAHGAFVPEASRTLAEAPIERIFVLDHIPPDALDPAFVAERVYLIDSAGLIADAICEMHAGVDGQSGAGT
ncbi:MAG: ribose-phosphate diphosphokinase [Acidobacteriota bacterium]|nr:ribose-phosphate diphosphokinase [Acidobacteriota bacterium]